MSRILRRPMFRGGRVDARGTGIASGLGYEKGGRVGLQTSYAGTVGNAYDKMIAKQNQWMNTKAVPQDYHTQQEKWKAYEPKYKTYEDLENAWQTELDNESALIDSYMIEGPLTPDADLYEREKWLQSEGGKTYWMDEQKAKQDEEIKAAKAFDVNIPTDLDKLIESQLANNEKSQPDISAREKQLEAWWKSQQEKDPSAEIEKNKAIFQKAYGSGVADDASAMLMGLAGKMLKPEATVKSGFGEFFEDEQKRPSERKKYKDAATTAAINAFLTGEKTLAEVEGFKAKTGYQIGAKSAAEKNKLLNASFEELKGLTQPANLKEKERVKGTAKLYSQYQNELLNENGTFNVIESKDNTPEQLFIEKYVGDYFMDSGTKEVFKIVILEDGTIGKKPISQG